MTGIWTLVLGVPNIRDGVSAHFSALVTLDAKTSTAFAISAAPGWRRGEFHLHTGHNDGSCDNGKGERIPYPVIRPLESAQHAGLDFIVVSDHATLSQAEALGELQPAFPDLLLLPGEEVTTFHGSRQCAGSDTAAEIRTRFETPHEALLDAVEAQGAILSINRPGQPSNEDCMGCGWMVADTDYLRIASRSFDAPHRRCCAQLLPLAPAPIGFKPRISVHPGRET